MFKDFYNKHKDAIQGGLGFSLVWLFITIGWFADNLVDAFTIVGVWSFVMVVIFLGWTFIHWMQLLASWIDNKIHAKGGDQ